MFEAQVFRVRGGWVWLESGCAMGGVVTLGRVVGATGVED